MNIRGTKEIVRWGVNTLNNNHTILIGNNEYPLMTQDGFIEIKPEDQVPLVLKMEEKQWMDEMGVIVPLKGTISNMDICPWCKTRMNFVSELEREEEDDILEYTAISKEYDCKKCKRVVHQHIFVEFKNNVITFQINSDCDSKLSEEFGDF